MRCGLLMLLLLVPVLPLSCMKAMSFAAGSHGVEHRAERRSERQERQQGPACPHARPSPPCHRFLPCSQQEGQGRATFSAAGAAAAGQGGAQAAGAGGAGGAAWGAGACTPVVEKRGVGECGEERSAAAPARGNGRGAAVRGGGTGVALRPPAPNPPPRALVPANQKVICATLTGVGSRQLERLRFDVVVIDEAAQVGAAHAGMHRCWLCRMHARARSSRRCAPSATPPCLMHRASVPLFLAAGAGACLLGSAAEGEEGGSGGRSPAGGLGPGGRCAEIWARQAARSSRGRVGAAPTSRAGSGSWLLASAAGAPACGRLWGRVPPYAGLRFPPNHATQPARPLRPRLCPHLPAAPDGDQREGGARRAHQDAVRAAAGAAPQAASAGASTRTACDTSRLKPLCCCSGLLRVTHEQGMPLLRPVVQAQARTVLPRPVVPP